MSTHQCGACQQEVPRARYCLECGYPGFQEVIPQTRELERDMDSRFGGFDFTEKGVGADFHTIQSSHEVYTRSLGGFLNSEEEPEAVSRLKKCTISQDDESWKLSPDTSEDGHILITNQRILGLIPSNTEAQVVPVNFETVIEVESRTGLLARKLVVNDLDGREYELALSCEKEELNAITETAKDCNQAVGGGEADATRFIQDVDDEISAADDAKTALLSIAELFEERDDRTYFDEVISEADSLNDLLTQGNVSAGDTEDSTSPANAELPSVPNEERLSLRNRVSDTVRGADRKDVGKWSVGAVLAGGALAVSAPFSTTAGVAALLTGGAATGAYASTHPNSSLAKVDPIELAMGVSSRGRQYSNSSAPGGYGVGAAVAAIDEVGAENPEMAYAKWLSEVEFESIVDGAEHAASNVEQMPGVESRRDAGIIGAAGGLAQNYADFDEDVLESIDEQLNEIESDEE